jgi:hypothetical protein
MARQSLNQAVTPFDFAAKSLPVDVKGVSTPSEITGSLSTIATRGGRWPKL